MRKILITGCAGFIGSHLSKRLLENGFNIIGIDNFSDNYPKKIKLRNMADFKNHSNFTFLEIDICDKEILTKILIDKVDLVIHLAAKSGVRPSIKSPTAYVQVNLIGTQNLLDWMNENNCNKLFFASSSSVYGNNYSQKAISEAEGADLKPISPYAFTKRSAELLNYTYHHLNKIDVINARFFTVYGPNQRPDLAIHKFIDLIENNKAIKMYGDGSSARDYTFIDDIVEGVLLGINYLFKHENVFETINIGSQNPIELRTLIELIYELTGNKKEIIQESLKEGDVNITYADISKANKLIGYKPKTDIRDGIEKFITWYRNKE